MNEIGKNLKELRSKSGISLRELAEEVDISHNTLATYERNDVVPTIYNAVRICEFYKVPVEYLIYGKKITTDFNDSELLRLFREIDGYEKTDRDVAKKILRKLVKNVKDRKDIEDSV
jgi:transcriptional regulator with XRE-family HTH domain